MHFIDTSALAKLFVREPGSEEMMRRMREIASTHKFISELTLLETRSAIRRRERSGELLSQNAELALRGLASESTRLRIWPLSSSLVLDAGKLIDRCRLRALDSLQLATALEIFHQEKRSVTFVSCDLFLLRAAKEEGLETWNPEV